MDEIKKIRTLRKTKENQENQEKYGRPLNLLMCADSGTDTKVSKMCKQKQNKLKICHLSPVACHLSPVTCHLAPTLHECLKMGFPEIFFTT